MNNNKSIIIPDTIEEINDWGGNINPLIATCQIKVFYVGHNRNGSYISKGVAKEMAKTLPGCPIVGAYREDIEDFGDHGEVIKIEDGEISVTSKTIPYGFINPYTDLWFQTFEDTLEDGSTVEREYLMANGYLWVGQFPEAKKALEGKGQSMELDPISLNGNWAYDDNQGMDFFIINDAVLSKLCILGDDVEPCFEGAAIKDHFSLDEQFGQRLFTMIKELNSTLYQEGGIPKVNNTEENLTEEIQEDVETEQEEISEPEEETEDTAEEVAEGTVEPTEDNEPAEEDKEPTVEEGEASEDNAKIEEDEEIDEVDAYSQLKEAQQLLNQTRSELNSLQEELASLREFKLNVENKEKDSLIAKYHMLSDEDKADVIQNKEKFSLEEIEAKLALIYVNKNVDFNTIDGKPEEVEEESAVTSFSLDEAVSQNEGEDDVLANMLRSVIQ